MLLLIGTLIIITALSIIYVAGKALYSSNVNHAHSILSSSNENLYTDVMTKLAQLRSYSVSSIFNLQNKLNVFNPSDDKRFYFINSVVIKNSDNEVILSLPTTETSQCIDNIKETKFTSFLKPTKGNTSICIYMPVKVAGKDFIAGFNVALDFFNKKTINAPTIISIDGVMDINIYESKFKDYNTEIKKVISNLDFVKERSSFIKTEKNFVLSQEAPRTNLRIISYNELGIMSSHYSYFIIYSLGTMLLILMISILAFYIIINKLLKPIKDLCTASKCFADGKYEQEIKGSNFAEINELIHSFNSMVERIKERETDLQNLNENLEKEVSKKSNELVHAAKMASLGTLSSGIAHEFNNILGALIGHVSLALEKKDKKEMESALEIALEASERACEIVSRLQDFSKNRGINFIKININEAINNVINLVQKDFINNKINIKTILQPDCFINGDRTQIEQVVLNLLINSKHAMPNGGIVEIKTWHDNNNVYIHIKDNGLGIDNNIKERIFEPFFTTKGVVGMGKSYGSKDSEGAGLGLSVSHGIVESHNGTIKLLESSSKGTTFELRFKLLT